MLHVYDRSLTSLISTLGKLWNNSQLKPIWHTGHHDCEHRLPPGYNIMGYVFARVPIRKNFIGRVLSGVLTVMGVERDI